MVAEQEDRLPARRGRSRDPERGLQDPPADAYAEPVAERLSCLKAKIPNPSHRLACTVALCVLGLVCGIFLILILTSWQHIDEFSQICVTDRSERWTVDGPATEYIWFWKTIEVREAVVLQQGVYAITENIRDGTRAVRHGPMKYFLGAYEQVESTNPAVILSKQQYLPVLNRNDGSQKIVKGTDGPDQTGVRYMPCASEAEDDDASVDNPCAYEQIGDVQSAVSLSKLQYVRVSNSLDGSLKIVKGVDGPSGDGLQYMPCSGQIAATGESGGAACAYEQIGAVQNARVVTLESALMVKATDTGRIRLVDEAGPFFPTPYEEILDSRSLIRVAEYETVVVEREDGSFEFHSGSAGAPIVGHNLATHNASALNFGQAAVPDPAESLVMATTAGLQDEGRGRKKMATTAGSSFFLPPYSNLVEFEWTVGYDVEDAAEVSNTDVSSKQKLIRIDQRLQQLFFQYDDVRTNDNIEFEVEGTIFWQIVDVPQLLRATDDPTGDIWHRLRAQLHQAASAYDYATFLTSLTNLTSTVKSKELNEFSGFYDVRGIRLYDLQLIEVELKDEELEKNIVDAMALEAIDRINRVNSEISEAEVEIVRLQGVHNVEATKAENERSIETIHAENTLQAAGNAAALRLQEQASGQAHELGAIANEIRLATERAAYLALARGNAVAEAETEGAAVGIRLGAALDEYLGAAHAAVLSTDERVRLWEMHQAYDNANVTSANLAGGTAELYLTPEAANLHLGDALRLNLPGEAPAVSSG